MLMPRAIPCLLIKNRGLVKTTCFRDPVYVGDPINAVRIFNEKEVDEVVLLDITATVNQRPPDIQHLTEIASEAFMPLCYGGGIRSLEHIRDVLAAGIEKVAINSYAAEDMGFVKEAARRFGSQSIVVSIDFKRTLLGRERVATRSATHEVALDPVSYARQAQDAGAGELLLTSVMRDGTMQGYDIDMIRRVTGAVSIPVIACGGAGRLADMSEAIKAGGASAAAAGSMFVFRGKHRAVLISYPDSAALRATLG